MQRQLLIVEDNRMMAQILKFNLEAAGYAVRLAYTVRQAMQELAERRHDLIITDYSLPDGTGETVCQQVRQSILNCASPLVLCSAKGYEIDQAGLQGEFGIAGFIYKPFGIPDVIQLIKHLTSDPMRVSV